MGLLCAVVSSNPVERPVNTDGAPLHALQLDLADERRFREHFALKPCAQTTPACLTALCKSWIVLTPPPLPSTHLPLISAAVGLPERSDFPFFFFKQVALTFAELHIFSIRTICCIAVPMMD